MLTTPNMGLTTWDLTSDPYDHSQLAANFNTIDLHDHTSAHGRQIPSGGIQDGAIITQKLADGSVTTAKIGDGQVTKAKLASGASEWFVGDTKSVWMPASLINTYVPPSTWVIMMGQTLTSSQHDFAGGGTIVLPDARNRKVLFADITGTGSGVGTPPGIGAIGGGHTIDVSHSHNVGNHSHSIPSHSHTVNSHSHGVSAHSHAIGSDGTHDHGFYDDLGNPQQLATRGAATSAGSTLQACYVAGRNNGINGTAFIDMVDAGGHNHGGGTGAAGTTTDSQTPGTSGIALATDAAGASTGNPNTDLSALDVRGKWIGLLLIIKVKN